MYYSPYLFASESRQFATPTLPQQPDAPCAPLLASLFVIHTRYHIDQNPTEWNASFEQCPSTYLHVHSVWDSRDSKCTGSVPSSEVPQYTVKYKRHDEVYWSVFEDTE